MCTAKEVLGSSLALFLGGSFGGDSIDPPRNAPPHHPFPIQLLSSPRHRRSLTRRTTNAHACPFFFLVNARVPIPSAVPLVQDFHKPFDSPAVLVVGHQTSGKSALIEALMGFQFNQVRRPFSFSLSFFLPLADVLLERGLAEI